MSEFLEILSPNALEQLKQAEELVSKLANDIKTINNFKPSNTPSGSDKNVQNLNTAYNERSVMLKKVSTELEKGIALQKTWENQAKNQTTATQNKTKAELDYVASVERGLKAKEREVLANKKLNDAYGQLTTKRNEAARALQNSIIETGKYSAKTQQLQKDFDGLNKKVGQADKAIGKFSQANNGIQTLTSGVGNLMSAFGISTGLFLGAEIVKNIYETTRALQSLDLSLKMVSDTQSKYAANTAFITSISEKWGLELKSTTSQFVKFYADAKGKLSEVQIKEVFEGIGKAASIMGLSVEKQESAFIAFQQMLSKGTVQAQELRQQLGDALPGSIKVATAAYQRLHPELKVTEKLFYKHMEQGKVISSEMIPEMVKGYQELYGIEMVTKVNTLSAAQNRLSNSWTNMVKHMTENGGSDFFQFLMNGWGNALNAIDRYITSWNTLQKESFGKGITEGVTMFKGAIGEAKGEEANKRALDKQIEARQILLGLREKEAQLIKKVNDWRKLGGTSVGAEMSEEELRKVQYNIGIYSSIIKESKTFLQPKTNTGTPAGVVETEEQKKKRLAAELKAEKDAAKEREQILKDEYDLKMSNLEVQKQLAQEEIDLANAITQNKEIQYNDVIDATKYYNGVLIAIEKAKYDEEVRLAGENSKEKEIAYNKWFISTLKLSKEMAESLLKVTQDFAKEGNDVAKKMLSDFEDNAKAFEEIDKRMTDSKIKNDKEALEAQRKTFNEFMGTFADKLGLGESFELFGELDENGKTYFGKLLEAEDKTKAYFLAVSTAAQDALNVIDQADEERYQRRLARLEKEKEVALGFAGDSAAAKEKIEADFDKKKKELEIKEFKRKQKMTIANIAIDTAQAAMASWAKTGFPWAAAAAIAMGAIQIGIVASQKVPEYWTGTDNAEAGLAWTQERGAEIVTDKKGNIKDFGSDKGARLTMMEAGDKVINAERTKRLMFNNELNSIMMDNGISNAPKIVVNSGMTKAEMKEALMETIGEQPHYHTNITEGGISNLVIKNGNITRTNSARGNSTKTRFT